MSRHVFGAMTAVLIVTCVALSLGPTIGSVSDAEAATLVGGEKCGSFGISTCGDGDPPPDPDCSANSCLCGGEDDLMNQTIVSGVYCGIQECGAINTTEPSDCGKKT